MGWSGRAGSCRAAERSPQGRPLHTRGGPESANEREWLSWGLMNSSPGRPHWPEGPGPAALPIRESHSYLSSGCRPQHCSHRGTVSGHCSGSKPESNISVT